MYNFVFTFLVYFLEAPSSAWRWMFANDLHHSSHALVSFCDGLIVYTHLVDCRRRVRRKRLLLLGLSDREINVIGSAVRFAPQLAWPGLAGQCSATSRWCLLDGRCYVKYSTSSPGVMDTSLHPTTPHLANPSTWWWRPTISSTTRRSVILVEGGMDGCRLKIIIRLWLSHSCPARATVPMATRPSVLSCVDGGGLPAWWGVFYLASSWPPPPRLASLLFEVHRDLIHVGRWLQLAWWSVVSREYTARYSQPASCGSRHLMI